MPSRKTAALTETEILNIITATSYEGYATTTDEEIRALSPREAASLAAQLGVREKNYEIVIPGVSDIIKYGAVKLTDSDVAFARRIKAVAVDSEQYHDIILSALGPEKHALFRQRAAMLASMSADPAPTWLRKLSWYSTWIDNIEDMTVTLGYLARPTAWALWKVAPSVAEKFAYPIGVVKKAGDVLNAMNFMRTIMFASRESKHRFKKTADKSMLIRGSKMLAVRKLRDLMPTWYEGIQIAQVAADWTGYGLVLGGIMGLPQEFASGAYRILTGEAKSMTITSRTLNTSVTVLGEVAKREPYEARFSKWSPATAEALEYNEQYLRELDQSEYDEYAPPLNFGLTEILATESPSRPVYAQPLDVFDKAAIKILTAAPWVHSLGDTVAPELHVKTAYAVGRALDVLSQSGVLVGVSDFVLRHMDTSLPAPAPLAHSVRSAEFLTGETYYGRPTWPLPGQPTHATPREVAEYLHPRVMSGLVAGLESVAGSWQDTLTSEIYANYTEPLHEQAYGAEFDTDPPNSIESRIIYGLLHYGLQSRLPSDPDRLVAVYNALKNAYNVSGSLRLSLAEHLRLMSVFGG